MSREMLDDALSALYRVVQTGIAQGNDREEVLQSVITEMSKVLTEYVRADVNPDDAERWAQTGLFPWEPQP